MGRESGDRGASAGEWDWLWECDQTGPGGRPVRKVLAAAMAVEKLLASDLP